MEKLKNNSVSQSVHLKANMTKTHTSIILEEYEPYSTGRWSYSKMNPHASALQNSTSSTFAQVRDEIEND